MPLRGNSPSGPCTVEEKSACVQPYGWTNTRVAETGAVKTYAPSSGCAILRQNTQPLCRKLAAWMPLSDVHRTAPASTPAAAPWVVNAEAPSFGRFKVGSRGGKSESRPWCLFLHGHPPLSPHREEMPEAPPAADEARAFRGSGAIGSPVQGPGIAMPRRCSEGGGGPSTTMVEFFHQIFKAGQGAFFAAICRIPPHRWTAVYSCGEPPHPRTPLSAAHSPRLWKSRHSLRLGPGAPCAFHQLLKAALSPGFIKPHPLGPQGGRIAISLQTVYTGRDSF